MAVLNVLIERSVEQVWSVLADGWSYSSWVVGTQKIREVDDNWPEEGSRLHYAVGISRLSVDDTTTVRIMEPRQRLELEARAGRAGTARISIQVLPWGEHAVVIIDEHPLRGPGARWHSLVVDGVLRFRNKQMLRNLDQVVSDRYPDPGRH
jgi:uncharacterized protein YndB with AHSA1/START domain